MTQMTSAQVEKKNTENQSIAAAVLRCSVGKAKAASTASGGRPSISARSDPASTLHASKLTNRQPSGTEMWRFCSWARQRHRVQSANGQAGHVNHSNCRGMAIHCAIEPCMPTRQLQALNKVASKAANTQAPAIHKLNRRTAS